MDTVTGAFWRHVRADPDKPSVHLVSPKGTRTYTRRELGDRAVDYQSALLRIGAPRGSIVLVFLPHSIDLYAAFIGAMSAGLIPSLMPCVSPKQDPRLYWTGHTELLRRIEPVAIVSNGATFAEMRAAGLPLDAALIDADATERAGDVPPVAVAEPGEICLVQHSSGTTGLKKGVALSNRNVWLQVESYAGVLGFTSEDVIVSWLPLYHDMGLVACFLMPLMRGVQIVHMDPFHWLARPDLLFASIERYGGTLVWLPNFAFEHLASVVPAGSAFRLDGVRAFINCSEPCRASTFRRFYDRFRDIGLRPNALQCCYATAESTFAITQTLLENPARRDAFNRDRLNVGDTVEVVSPEHPRVVELLSSGNPIAGIECRVQHPVGTDSPEATIGQIVVKGGFVFSGYFKNGALSAERIRDGWYDTHDLGFFHNGALFVLGRTDDVIICNGKNIFAHDVENAAAGVPGLKPGRCVAVPIDDARSGTQKFALIAEYEIDDPETHRRARLRVRNQIFAAVAVAPYDVELVPQGWLVKTTSGKISRKENREKYLQRPRLQRQSREAAPPEAVP